MGASDDSGPFVIDPSGRDLHGDAARLRARGPATRIVLPGGVGAWAVTGPALLRRLLTDDRVSKDAYLHWPPLANGDVGPGWQLFPWVAVRNMLTAYGDDHRRLRRLVSSAFTPRRTATLRPRVEAIVADLLGELGALAAGGSVDLRDRYAYPLPIRVICELFGVADPDAREEIRRCVDAFFRTTAGPEEAAAAFPRMQEIIRGIVREKRARPADDLSSALIAARDEGSPLSEEELVGTLMLFLSAGHETTVNLLDNAIHAMLVHPGQLALVRAGRAAWDDVIEETLRAEPPVANLPLRFAVEDIVLDDGVVIGKGEAILACYAAAGRDAAAHGDDADLFDVTRADKEHLAFGHGVHYCLGAPLARLEAAIALPALFTRFPGMALAVKPDELRPLDSFISNGHRALPVLLIPGW
ncbi:cytochrome P450 family protein [Actinomadura macrotermitis]|uniref:2-hydroxy-5-methyl-1-naphthoate 7-hydroxylase n=1 Tax=Actinomadura macrotermitis TaxID=2585200 RepID=A0A7K0C1N7_9ACTN|nr:cytochrome P450 [Actinomadura macrotermitis]MQY07276.1 2-hydroxy-5-methyl-1-naphthoate 7-hydroxylase [Actinomadura macrotermitis]